MGSMARLVRVVRNVEFGRLFDSFFVTAVTTVLAVRFYLKLAGYPQLGSSTLHISHLLPGSLLLLVAFLVLLSSVNRAVREFSAIVAGVGFGLVWDELGKFITKNNNYFFKATPGLIYLTFVLLYLVARYAMQRRFTQEEYLANVLDILKDGTVKDLDPREYAHAQELMAHVSRNHTMYQPTLTLLEQVKPNARREPLIMDRLIYVWQLPLHWLSRRRFFSKLVITVAVAYGLASLAAAVFLFAGAASIDFRHLNTLLQGDESDLVGGASALISAVCTAIATFKYARSDTRRAYKFFELGLLVNIFIGQVVLFFKNPGTAFVWLAATLILLTNVKILASENPKNLAKLK